MAKDIVTISGKDVERIEYRSVPVITLRMMDELHERPEGTARKRFADHKDKLIENQDYFRVPYEEWSKVQPSEIRTSENPASKQHAPMTFLTQSGYLLLVKSFTDDLAWQVQRELVKCYFVVKTAVSDVDRLTKEADIFCAAVRADTAKAKAIYEKQMLCYKIAQEAKKGKIIDLKEYERTAPEAHSGVQKHLNKELSERSDRDMKAAEHLSGILKGYAEKGQYFTRRELEKEKAGKPVIDGMQSKFNGLKRTEISDILDFAVRKWMITEDTKIIGKGQTRVIYVPE